MGRAASIGIEDVRTARAELVAANKPHGIIAIRNQIGRGSPQLISKLLTELEGPLPAVSNQKSKMPTRQNQAPTELNHAWRTVAESIENLIVGHDASAFIAPDSGTQASLSKTSDGKNPVVEQEEKLGKLEQLVSQQQSQLDKLEAFNHKLGEQLMQQQDLFDSWRHEQHAERQLLKTQLDQLMQVVTKKPVRKAKKKGEQLDLYRDGNN